MLYLNFVPFKVVLVNPKHCHTNIPHTVVDQKLPEAHLSTNWSQRVCARSIYDPYSLYKKRKNTRTPIYPSCRFTGSLSYLLFHYTHTVLFHFWLNYLKINYTYISWLLKSFFKYKYSKYARVMTPWGCVIKWRIMKNVLIMKAAEWAVTKN